MSRASASLEISRSQLLICRVTGNLKTGMNLTGNGVYQEPGPDFGRRSDITYFGRVV